MVSVFFHYKEHGGVEWRNERQEFTRIPVVGEYVTLSSTGGLHRVYAVIHCPFNDAEYQAEVFTYAAMELQSDVIGASAPLPFQASTSKFDPEMWSKLGKGRP